MRAREVIQGAPDKTPDRNAPMRGTIQSSRCTSASVSVAVFVNTQLKILFKILIARTITRGIKIVDFCPLPDIEICDKSRDFVYSRVKESRSSFDILIKRSSTCNFVGKGLYLKCHLEVPGHLVQLADFRRERNTGFA